MRGLLLLLLLSSAILQAAPLPGLPSAEQQTPPANQAAATESLAGQWQQLTFWILQKQRQYHRALADGMESIQQQPDWQNTWLLLSLSFFYGIFHAAGPGHGKAVLTTYLLTRPEQLRRGLLLSLLAALLQGLTAILLVGLLVHGLGWLARETFASVLHLERLSFLMILLLGLWLIGRAIRQAWSLRPAEKTPLHSFTPVRTPLAAQHLAPVTTMASPVCADCGKVHHVAPAQVEGRNWVENTGLLLSIGLRPCSGAVLVLVVANLLGLWWVGVLSALAMALGTALTVGTLALVAVQARQLAQRLVRLQGNSLRLLGIAAALLGGLVILLLGTSLLLGSLNQNHPLGLF